MRLNSCRLSRTRQKRAGEFLFSSHTFEHALSLTSLRKCEFQDVGRHIKTSKPSDPMNTQSPSPCPANSWAPSSAFYFLLSLALGCISHPRGSLTFRRSSRAWRLSPFFLLIENARICIYFLQCLDSEGWRWRWGKVRVYAYAVLALREGNAWRQIE
jgi:hypothetical protein